MWEFSSGYVDGELERIPTLVHVLVLFFGQVRTKDGLYWFENHRAFIRKQIFLYLFFIITMSFPQTRSDNPPRKIPYYHLNQSTLVIKQ
jgi:hypothetical protein